MPIGENLTIQQAVNLIESQDISAAELDAYCRERIGRLDSHLRAFITVLPQASDERESSTGRLAGIPIAIKDLFDIAGWPTTGGCRFFEDHQASTDAQAVRRLRNSGANIIGKTNTHEIALGVTTQNPHFGACKNPWNTDRIPGGSSGGSAVAVATGMALGALGTDTGGSIRIPAALCGLVGLKPSYGRISVRGVLPLSWNLDHVGLLTRSVGDAAILLQVLAGFDTEDAHSIDAPVPEFDTAIEHGIAGFRIAVATGAYADAADTEVRHSVETARVLLVKLGAHVVSEPMDFLRDAALANGIITPADGAAFHKDRLAQHPEMFGEDVRRRLELGRDTPSSDYIAAREVQVQTKHRMRGFFGSYDILVLPSTPIAAPERQGHDAVEQARRLTYFTSPFNLTGLPALSLPCGLNSEGMPQAIQLVAAPWAEATLLRCARAIENELSPNGFLAPPISDV